MTSNKVANLVTQAQEQMRRQDYRGAIGSFTMALQLEPDTPEIYRSRGLLHYLLRQYENAIADFSQALDYEPGNADLCTNRGMAYLRQGASDAALDDFNEAL